VMFWLNECTKPIERYAPPIADSMPDSVTAAYRVLKTEMPTVSAARGCSPTERSRSPVGVRKTTKYVTIRSRKDSQIKRLRSPNAGGKKLLPDDSRRAGIDWPVSQLPDDRSGVPFEP